MTTLLLAFLLAAPVALAGCTATRPVETTTLGVGKAGSGDRTLRSSQTADPLPTPPVTTVRLLFTLPDSVEWRRGCGWSLADSAANAHSDMRAEIVWVPRFGPPYWPPPRPLAESLLCVTGWRYHGSAVDTVIQTPGHGALFVRARNAVGVWCNASNLTHSRTEE